MTTQPQSQLQPPGPRIHRQQHDEVDLKRYLFLFLENWYWLVISVIVCVTAAYLVNKYTIREYKVSSALLIEDQTNPTGSFISGGAQGGNDMFSGFGLYPNMKMIENQMIILQSYNQVKTTIHSVDFEVSYFKEEVSGKREVYGEAPFIVSFDRSRPQPLGVIFRVTEKSGGRFSISAEVTGDKVDLYDYLTETVTGFSQSVEIKSEISFGEPVEGKNYLFTILPGKKQLKEHRSRRTPGIFILTAMMD